MGATGATNLTVQVHNISPKATEEDLIAFFSYCGTIDKTHLQREDDRSQSAFVTFKQPYAFQTALLLNDATIIDRRVSISPVEIETSVPILPCSPKNREPEAKRRRLHSCSASDRLAREGVSQDQGSSLRCRQDTNPSDQHGDRVG
ncbi:uncharacterized protein M6B38_278790 [Iris pallida]|uniref:RRM domain-containing protein n=1 Tax=Iris pallida TaxID=29817 RepID=A0AAX6I012_IRIPA|nr:uncharacterized protein M6B38_278790 [Iris pallida]